MKIKAALILVVLTGLFTLNINAQDKISKPAKSKFEFVNVEKCPFERVEELLGKLLTGHFIVKGDVPLSTPVNSIYDNDQKIYFPISAKEDKNIIDRIKKDSSVFFSTDNMHFQYWEDIHIFGKAEIISDDKVVSKLQEKYKDKYGEAGFAINKDIAYIRLTPDKITSRKIGTIGFFLGKLDWNNNLKGKPFFEIDPASKDKTQFTEGVKFEGLPAAVADAVIRQGQSGRINTFGEKYPYSVALNYGFARGKIIYHSKNNGMKVKNAVKNQNVSFDIDWFWDGKYWYTVTIEGKAKLLPAKEGIESMQYFSKFLEMKDGRIPKDYKPEKMADEMVEKMGKMIKVFEITPEKVITRRAEMPDKWFKGLPDLLKKPVNIEGHVTQWFQAKSQEDRLDAEKKIIDKKCNISEVQIAFDEYLSGDKAKAKEPRYNVTFQNKEINNYLVQLPKDYAAKDKWPLLVAFHASMSNGAKCYERWKDHAKDYILVCPNGTNRMGWTLGAIHLPYITNMLNDVEKRFKVDPNRVYITGHSMGGHVVWNLATLHPDRFAAVAPTASRPTYQKYLDNLKSLPIYAVVGEKDTIVPIDQLNNCKAYVNKNGGNIEVNILKEQGHAFLDGEQKNIMEFFNKHKREQSPKKLEFLTTSPPFDAHYWVYLENITRQNKFSKIKASIKDNVVDINCEEVQKLTVYFNEDMIDFSKPVIINVNGKKVHEAKVDKDLNVFFRALERGRQGFGLVGSVSINIE